MGSDSGEITRLLVDWSNGNEAALEEVIVLVYPGLHAIARERLRHERPDHTLQATALVHEAFTKLVEQNHVRWEERAHFFAVAARIMRRILVDHARKTGAAKRPSRSDRVTLDDVAASPAVRADDLVKLDEAMDRLAILDPRQGRIVELRFFGGLTIDETAAILRISPATVKNEWRVARAWLHDAIGHDGKT